MFKKINVFQLVLIAFLGIFIFSSCEKEKMEELATTNSEVRANSGEEENDESNPNDDDDHDHDECLDDCEEFCFEFTFPITVIFPDGTTQEVNDEDELETLSDEYYDQDPEPTEDLTLAFPIEVTFEDGSTEIINDEDEFWDILDACYEDEDDEEGEHFEDCFEFVYPLTVVLPDGTSVTVNNDEELENAVEDWYDQNPDSEDDPTLAYPIEVTFEDGSTTAINSDEELEDLVDECFGEEFDECFELNFPVNLLLPGAAPITVNDYDALYTAVDAWYDANPDSDEDPTFEFPITVTIDGAIVTINNEDELDELFDDCYDDDDDCEFNGSNLVIGLHGTATTKAVAKKLN